MCSRQSQLVNGVSLNFDDNRFPWMLALWLVHLTFKAPTCGAALISNRHATLWARIAQNVKKPPLTVNVIDLEFVGFDVSIWVPWSPHGPKKS